MVSNRTDLAVRSEGEKHSESDAEHQKSENLSERDGTGYGAARNSS